MFSMVFRTIFAVNLQAQRTESDSIPQWKQERKLGILLNNPVLTIGWQEEPIILAAPLTLIM